MSMISLLYCCSVFMMSCLGQFAPQAGLAGSTALHKDSSIFINWAREISLERGWQDISDTSLGRSLHGNQFSCWGMADQDVVSLGDGGIAKIYFENPIRNGVGYDFAIFENGFRHPVDSNLAYLELAKVAVSSDGWFYVEFPVECLNDTTMQIPGTGDYMDARNIHNLAGKYISGYGTPFDLSELSGISGLDIDHIRHIRIQDVVGTLDATWAGYDKHQRKINDPFPTPFPTGGFDLDAVGVIHQAYPTSVMWPDQQRFRTYPNPCQTYLYVDLPENYTIRRLTDIQGREVPVVSEGNRLSMSQVTNGVYWLIAEHPNQVPLMTTIHVQH